MDDMGSKAGKTFNKIARKESPGRLKSAAKRKAKDDEAGRMFDRLSRKQAAGTGRLAKKASEGA